MTKLLHVFFDTDMRGRHEALDARALEDRKFDVKKLKPGDVLCFINTKQDRLMLLSGVNEQDTFGILGYYRSPHGRIDLKCIGYIQESFGGSAEVTMQEALRKRLDKHISRSKDA